MVYLLFAVCSYLYLLLLSKYKEVGYKTVIVFSLPVIFAWVLIIGSQYYVGTDYPTYLSLRILILQKMKIQSLALCILYIYVII